MLTHFARAAAGLALAASVSSQAGAWQVGNWFGRTVNSDTGEFAGCRMSVPYDTGITLHFLHLRGGSLLIGLSQPGWSLNSAGQYSMGLVIDGRFVRRARGVVLAGMRDAVFLDLGRDRATRELLQRRFLLTLVNGGRSIDFRLTGTAAALERLETCARTGA